MRDLSKLYKKFGIKEVHNEALYDLAFTHSSYNADLSTHHHDYERLEFLGDSIVGAVVANLAFKARPELNQGNLTKLKSSLVRTDSLAKYAKEYNLKEFVLFGNSYIQSERNENPLLEDVFEAFFGAIYLDQGYEFAYELIKKIFYKDILLYSPDEVIDYKSKLQEAMQSEYRKSVTYETISQSGPAHERSFEVAVYFEDQLLATGYGKSKKAAEQEAAKNALKKAGK